MIALPQSGLNRKQSSSYSFFAFFPSQKFCGFTNFCKSNKTKKLIALSASPSPPKRLANAGSGRTEEEKLLSEIISSFIFSIQEIQDSRHYPPRFQFAPIISTNHPAEANDKGGNLEAQALLFLK